MRSTFTFFTFQKRKTSKSGILEIHVLPPGGTLMFYTYVGSVHLWGFEILNFNFFGGSQKNEYFWGMKILRIFLGSSQNRTIFRGHFYAFYATAITPPIDLIISSKPCEDNKDSCNSLIFILLFKFQNLYLVINSSLTL